MKTTKAWYPLNVSVLATDRSCLLARTSLRWAGFHRQASQGLLRGLLDQRYVNRAAHSAFITNNDVPRVVVIFVLALLFFFGGQKFFFVSCILSEITTFRK